MGRHDRARRSQPKSAAPCDSTGELDVAAAARIDDNFRGQDIVGVAVVSVLSANPHYGQTGGISLNTKSRNIYVTSATLPVDFNATVGQPPLITSNGAGNEMRPIHSRTPLSLLSSTNLYSPRTETVMLRSLLSGN
jgi:hypothetical protein